MIDQCEHIQGAIDGEPAALATPCYVYCERCLDEDLMHLRGCLPDDGRIFYSMKANARPFLLAMLAARGIGVDIASVGEWRTALDAGFAATDILVGGLCKAAPFLELVCDTSPAAIVLDSFSEWRRLREVRGRDAARILIRINPGRNVGGLQMGRGTPFGLTVADAVVLAREIASSQKAEWLGLHFYFGTQRLRNSRVIETVSIAEELVAQSRSFGVDVRCVDLGMGIGVPYLQNDETPRLDLLAPELRRRWKCAPWSSIPLWSEAGRLIVARCGTFIARVLESKRIHERIFVHLDGGLDCHNPGLSLGRAFAANPRLRFVTGGGTGQEETFSLVGRLCTPADCLARDVVGPRLVEGDLVLVPNAGAYCHATALANFIGFEAPAEYVLGADGALRRWSSPQLTPPLMPRPHVGSVQRQS